MHIKCGRLPAWQPIQWISCDDISCELNLLYLPVAIHVFDLSTKIHGWPDLAIGWRFQIPVLLKMGYRVVCPDLMGFGGTEAPRAPPESMSFYSFKRAADDIRELARQLGTSQIILGGHDWVRSKDDSSRLCS